MLQKNWMELIKPSKLDVNVQENDGKTGRLIAEPLERGFGLTYQFFHHFLEHLRPFC